MARVTTATLLGEMTDLSGLATKPDPFYTTCQFSSYDRRSVAPDKPGWFANGDNANTTDRRHYIRDEKVGNRVEHVLADMRGPGALVRFWSANPWVGEGGKLRVYLDDDPTPVIEADLMELVNGKARIPEPFTSRAAGGAGNVYFPIPFAQSCKVTHDADWRGFYYQVNFRRYVSSADVESFAPNHLTEHADVIREVGARLADPMNLVVEALDGHEIDVTVSPGSRGDAVILDGPAAIGTITLRVSAPDPRAALRQTLLQVYFDASPTPQIESPLGDFFGAGPGVCPYQSLPFVVEPDGTMHCRLVMPFAHSARVHIANFGKQTVTVTGGVVRTPHTWSAQSMHLRAKWRVTHGAVGSPDGYDMTYLILHGSGVWVGTALMIMNPTDIPTPGGGWWGEGDEKVYVDGESFPSTFGTGSEDYFGYSWSSPDLFQGPLIGQPRCDGPGNRGFTSNYRWHILDALPFAKSLEFLMELQTHVPTPGITYARIGYCYTTPGARDDHPQIHAAMLRIEDPPAWIVRAAGAAQNSTVLEAEDLARSGIEADVQHDARWSNVAQVGWDGTPGDVLSLSLPIEEAGKYRVILCLTTRPGGGTCRIALSGNAVDHAFDLSHPSLTMTREVDAGVHDLAAGDAELSLICQVAGAIGIDYVRLARAQ